MTVRTSRRTVSFRRPFALGQVDGLLPAGDYTVETDVELLEGVSLQAYRRIQTLIYLRDLPGHPGVTQIVAIDPDELDAALQNDRVSADAPVGNDAPRQSL